MEYNGKADYAEPVRERIIELLGHYGSYARIERVSKALGRRGPGARTLGKIVNGGRASLRTWVALKTLPDRPPDS